MILAASRGVSSGSTGFVTWSRRSYGLITREGLTSPGKYAVQLIAGPTNLIKAGDRGREQHNTATTISPSGTARSITCATPRSGPEAHCCLSAPWAGRRGSLPTYGKLQAAGPEQAVPPSFPQAPPPHRTHAACGPQNGRQSASRWHGKHCVSNEQNPALPVVVSQRPVPPPGRAHATDGPPLPPHSVSGCPALQPPVS